MCHNADEGRSNDEDDDEDEENTLTVRSSYFDSSTKMRELGLRDTEASLSKSSLSVAEIKRFCRL